MDAEPPPLTQADEKQGRLWAMLCHLTALAGLVGIPLGHILGPLIIWLIKKEEFPSVAVNGKEALNFQISMTIYALVAAVLIMVVVGFILLIGLWVADVVLVIMASIKVNQGQSYRYPFTIRLIK